MSQFTLEPRRWYAMDMTFPFGGQHASPVLIFAAVPRKTGHGQLDLEFWHANYSPGVQRKNYELRVLRRTDGYLLTEEAHSTEPRTVIFREVDVPWINLHRFHTGAALSSNTDPQSALDRCYFPDGRSAIGL